MLIETLYHQVVQDTGPHPSVANYNFPTINSPPVQVLKAAKMRLFNFKKILYPLILPLL